MTKLPRIAIPVPTSFDPAYNARSWPEYAVAVDLSGGIPLQVDLQHLPDAAEMERFDGILLPGSGADVSPGRYGQAAQPETAAADGLREAMDKALLEQVDKAGVPLLAICFGLQSLNVHRGGTLVQHLLPIPVNHRAGRPVFEAHAAQIEPGSRLSTIIASGNPEGTTRLMVNSSHHQAVSAIGRGLTLAARSTEDSVVEALEDAGHPWLVGVQWHPERTFEHSVASRAIFSAFIAAAGKAR